VNYYKVEVKLNWMASGDDIDVTTPGRTLIYRVNVQNLISKTTYTVVDAEMKELVTIRRAFTVLPRFDVVDKYGATIGTLRRRAVGWTTYVDFDGYPAMKIGVNWLPTSKRTFRVSIRKSGILLAKATSEGYLMSVTIPEKENAFPILIGLSELFYDYIRHAVLVPVKRQF